MRKRGGGIALVGVMLAGALAVSAHCGDKLDPVPSGCNEVLGRVTYGDQIKAIFDTHCIRCHATTKTGAERSGAPAGFDFDTFEAATATASGDVDVAADANRQIQARTMPFGQAKALTDRERCLVQAWIDQGKLR